MGFSFNRQRPIDKYIVDFYGKDLMLAIEIDGASHHHSEIQRKDIYRQQRLESLGVRFLRFDDAYVRKMMDDVLIIIQYWIEEHQGELVGREPTPDPSEEGTNSKPSGNTQTNMNKKYKEQIDFWHNR